MADEIRTTRRGPYSGPRPSAVDALRAHAEEHNRSCALPIMNREKLLRDALNDAKQAVECMEAGDWLRADILMKLAIDQLADTGLIP